MSIPIPIEKLIDENIVEQARVEYKEGWNPESTLHTLCAYANDIDNWGGGYLVIGVEEKNGLPQKPVKGLPLEKIDAIQKELLDLCRNKIQPSYMPVCEPVTYEGKKLLFIWAPGGYERPYQARVSLAKNKKDSTYYVRRFSSTIQATKTDIKELHDIGGNIPFDDRVNYHAGVSELQLSWIKAYLNAVGSSLLQDNLSLEDLALSMKVIKGPAENLHPLNVGLMFFTDDPAEYFREAIIEIVDIPDPTGEGMTERTFRGPLDRQLSEALAYIRNNVIAEKIFKNPQKAEADRVFSYPYLAIEEALTNAVYHKSYQIPEPVTIRIEKACLEITNCPGPDRSIPDSDFKQKRFRAGKYRNRRIGEFLKELHLIEERGTGVPTMIKSLEENGSDPPEFKTDEDRSFFSVTFKIHPTFIKNETPQNNSVKKSRRTREELRIAVLATLKQADYSKNELSKKLGYSGVSKTLTEVVEELLDERVIEYTASLNNPNAKLTIKQ